LAYGKTKEKIKLFLGEGENMRLRLNPTATPHGQWHLPRLMLDLISDSSSRYLATNTACHREACYSIGNYKISFDGK
jgi:hypothetical protein